MFLCSCIDYSRSLTDREIYGLYLKNEPFFLERCKKCSTLLKTSVVAYHYSMYLSLKSLPRSTRGTFDLMNSSLLAGICIKKNGIGLAKKTTFTSPNKKKSTKRSNKSTSEDDSESIISSENSSPALDLIEGQVIDSSSVTSIRDDSIIDVISVEEIPSEDSKPPTPGPQDLYEEFATPFSEVSDCAVHFIRQF